jgi:hypothetical protein
MPIGPLGDAHTEPSPDVTRPSHAVPQYRNDRTSWLIEQNQLKASAELIRAQLAVLKLSRAAAMFGIVQTASAARAKV